METLCYTLNNLGLHKQPVQASKTKDAASTSSRPHLLRNSANYVIDALGEGLKQNFLGNDINMEFLTLTVRSLAQTSVTAVQQFIHKHSTARAHHTEGAVN